MTFLKVHYFFHIEISDIKKKQTLNNRTEVSSGYELPLWFVILVLEYLEEISLITAASFGCVIRNPAVSSTYLGSPSRWVESLYKLCCFDLFCLTFSSQDALYKMSIQFAKGWKLSWQCILMIIKNVATIIWHPSVGFR